MTRQPHARPIARQRPRLAPCGRPDCPICNFQPEGEPPQEERLALELIAGALGTILLFVLLFLVLPALVGAA
jgi:hypothetical protein